MSSIITAVFKATFGLLVNKARDKAAENLKEGDMTDKRIRDLIQREIDDIKSKLDGLARKDLVAAIDAFEAGVKRPCALETTNDFRLKNKIGPFLSPK